LLYFQFFLLSKSNFFLKFEILISFYTFYPSPSFRLYPHLCYLSLLALRLLLDLFLILNLHFICISTLLVLLICNLDLFCLLFFWEINGLLYLTFFFLSLSLNWIKSVLYLFLWFELDLMFMNFLKKDLWWNKNCSTFKILSSFRFLIWWISSALLRVSSIFFHVFTSSYFKSAILFANNCASLSTLYR
jgi:hypothetical protein